MLPPMVAVFFARIRRIQKTRASAKAARSISTRRAAGDVRFS
jgi:hypothetical protein